jgi:2-amino-4-hydroxy-6-hydroxymethyldihydropteridine diphosphokinase
MSTWSGTPTVPTLAYLLLGSNLGDRAALLAAARQQLATTAGEVVAESGIYETAAWGREDQPAYLNQVLAIATWLRPEVLLAACQATEQAAGRQRHERWGSRTLDVDILFFGAEIIDSPTLMVPHPRLSERRFALVPLAEIAGALRHPQSHYTIRALLARCPDPLPVRPWPGE